MPFDDSEEDKIVETLRLIGSNPLIEHVLLPSKDAQACLENKIQQYEAMLSSEDLLVLYHFGHGGVGRKGFRCSGQRTLMSRESLLYWAPIQKTLQRMQADKLVFMFSCHAGAIVSFDEKGIVGNETGGRMEIIAACKADQVAVKGPNRLDFMKNLRRKIVFQTLYSVTAYSSSRALHSSMFRRLMLAGDDADGSIEQSHQHFGLHPANDSRGIALQFCRNITCMTREEQAMILGLCSCAECMDRRAATADLNQFFSGSLDTIHGAQSMTNVLLSIEAFFDTFSKSQIEDFSTQSLPSFDTAWKVLEQEDAFGKILRMKKKKDKKER